MGVVPYIELNVLGLLVCIIVLINQKRSSVALFGDRLFKCVIYLTMAIIVMDALSWLMIVDAIVHTYPIHMTVVSTYYILQTLIPFVLLIYIIAANDTPVKLWHKIVIRLPILFTLIGVIVNVFVPFVFGITESGRCERLSGFLVVGIWPLLYILASVVFSLKRYFTASDSEKTTAGHILLFCMLGLAMGILRTVFYDCSIWPIIAIGILYLYLNVHILKSKEIEELAYTDALTGLFNATAYRIRLNNIDEQIRNRNAEFAVVIMDINDLKIVNDRMSHQAGNQLIIAAARFISNIFVNSKIYRIGGDEFVAVLEGEDYLNRKQLVGQFFRKIGMLKFSYDSKDYPLSVAIGYADYDIKKEMHYADVFKMADRNMYENKKLYKTGNARLEKNYN